MVAAATVLPGVGAPPAFSPDPDAGYWQPTSRLVTSALAGSPIAVDGTDLWAIPNGFSVEEVTRATAG